MEPAEPLAGQGIYFLINRRWIIDWLIHSRRCVLYLLLSFMDGIEKIIDWLIHGGVCVRPSIHPSMSFMKYFWVEHQNTHTHTQSNIIDCGGPGEAAERPLRPHL